MPSEKTTSFQKIQEGISDTSKQIQEGFTDLSRDFWLASLGLIATVEEEATGIYNRFVDRGKEFVEKGKEFEKRDKEQGISARITDTAAWAAACCCSTPPSRR